MPHIYNGHDVFSKFRGNAPASAAELASLESEIGFKLPKDYVAFLERSNGGEGFIGPNAHVIFWQVGELVQINRAYEVNTWASGLFIFGSDGGGEAYAFDVRAHGMPIVSVPFIGMSLSLARVMAPTFQDFLEALSHS